MKKFAISGSHCLNLLDKYSVELKSVLLGQSKYLKLGHIKLFHYFKRSTVSNLKADQFLFALPVKKLASLTKLLSSVCIELPEVKEELELPEGLRGTCNVLE